MVRGYTDIEQSRKLAEILPLESADMCCFQNQNGSINCYGFPFSQANKASNPIPVWSLAALLNNLPNYECKCTVLSRGGYDTEIKKYVDEWKVSYNEANGQNRMIITSDNPMDACYEMILKLHESNLL